MALNRQLVSIPVDNGLDTKSDPKQQPFGFLRKAENVVYETIKLLKKRNGYDALEFRDSSNAQLSGAVKLAKYKQELLVLTNSQLLSYSATRGRFIARGYINQTTVSTESIIKNAATQDQMDSLVIEGFLVTVWKDSASGVRYSVKDLESNSFIINDGSVGTGERPQIANIGGIVYIIYGNGTALNHRNFSIFQPDVLSPIVQIANNRDTSVGLIDAHPCGSKLFVAYNSTVAGDELAIFSISEGSVLSSILNITGEMADTALHVTCDSSSRILIAYSNNTEVKYLSYNFLLTAQILAPTVIETITDITNVALIETSAGNYRAYYEKNVAAPANNYIRQANLTIGGSVASPTLFVRSLGLAGRPFTYDSVIYVPTVHDSDIQSSYFLYSESGRIITKWSNQNAGSNLTFGVLPNVSAVTDTSFQIASLFKNRLQTDGQLFFSTEGVQSSIIEFAPESSYSNAQMADSLHICAGLLRIYDGSTVSEDGFQVFPENLLLSSAPTTGGFMSDGTYDYVAVYRWTDNTGKDHNSVPTLTALTVTLAGGTSTQQVIVTVPTLRITEKSNVVLDLYRTENNGTVFYKVTSSTSPVFNDTTVDTINITDSLADATIISNETLYTTGGILENVAPPACYQITPLNNRLAFLGENKQRVFFSKEISEGRPVEYSDAIYRDIDPTAGNLSAIKAMQDKLIAFTEDASFFIVGDGPNNAGEQDNFTKPEILSTDIGCISPDSLVLTPMGLSFKSRKGIWELGGGMGLTYTGARVEEFNSQSVTSAQVVGELNQVRFTLDTDRALVYNYNVDRWATFENHGAKSSVVIGNDYYYIREDGNIWQENRSSFSDNGSPIRTRIETGWLQMTEIQGFQRVYKLMLLGAYKSLHKLKVLVAYDFIEAFVQEDLINPLDFLTPTTYGSSTTYGSDTVYGGDGSLYQARVDLGRQKCQSIKFSLEDVQSVAGASFDLSAMTVQVGAKVGTGKISSANTSGTS